MATFNFTPSFSADLGEEPNIRETQFGDGYEQRLSYGLNTQPRKWALQFLNRADIETEAIATFLRARGGAESFDWTDPDGYAAKWKCGQWNKSKLNCNNNTISASFEQVFEP